MGWTNDMLWICIKNNSRILKRVRIGLEKQKHIDGFGATWGLQNLCQKKQLNTQIDIVHGFNMIHHVSTNPFKTSTKTHTTKLNSTKSHPQETHHQHLFNCFIQLHHQGHVLRVRRMLQKVTTPTEAQVPTTLTTRTTSGAADSRERRGIMAYLATES